MAGLADLFGGNSAFGSGALYGDLLTPEQKQALAWRGLMSAAGALGQAAMPSRMPVPLGAALGQAAGAMASGSDEAALNALRATMLAQQAQQLKQKNDFVNKLFGQLPGLLDSVTGGTPAVPASAATGVNPSAAVFGGAAPAAGMTTGAPDMGGGMRAGGALTGDPLALIEKYESGGRNIMQQAVPPQGGYNPSVGRVTGPSTAQGYYQITNSTWRDTAPKAGVDLDQYPTAMSAPKDVQAQVAQTLFNEQGFRPWASYNSRLAAAINSGTSAPVAAGGDTYSGSAVPAQVAQNAPAPQAAPFGSLAPQAATLSPQALKTIIGMGIAGDLFGIPSLGNLLTNTPQYKAAMPEFNPQIQGALEAARANARVGPAYLMPDANAALQQQLAAGRAAGQQSVMLPADMAREAYKAQVAAAQASNQPQTLSPGQTVNINPNRVPIPAPPIALPPGVAAPQQTAQAVPLAPPQAQSAPAPVAPQAGQPTSPEPQLVPGGGLTMQGMDPGDVERSKIVPQEYVNDLVKNRLPSANVASQNLSFASTARDLLKNDMIVGWGSNLRLDAAKAAKYLGLADDQSIANTETLLAQQARQVAAILATRAFGAGSGISDEDRRWAAKMAAADSNLEKDSMLRIIDLSERASKWELDKYNKDVDRFDPSNQFPYLRVTQMPAPPMPASSAPPTPIPQGARQIGTYQGKPVYLMPDGSRKVLQ